MHYEHSPKIILIAGPPAAGKTHAAQLLAESLGYRHIPLDGINGRLCRELGVEPSMLRQPLPEISAKYKTLFVEALREARYQNLVLEGARITYPHVHTELMEAIAITYGDYTILRPFHLQPPDEVRYKQYAMRRIRMHTQSVKDQRAGTNNPLLEREKNKPFETNVNPPLPGYQVVRDCGPILGWARRFQHAKHPDLLPEFEDLLRTVAESKSYVPFYQRIELNGKVMVPGFTRSHITWKNILNMGVDLADKSVCDLGTMHGYFAFKAEEMGAHAVGYDICPHAVALARDIALVKGSQCRFEVLDVTETPLDSFDVIFALNMIHRVSNPAKALENILASGRELVLEIGMDQSEDILPQALRQGFRVVGTHVSHRHSNVLGRRALFHLRRPTEVRTMAGSADQPHQART